MILKKIVFLLHPKKRVLLIKVSTLLRADVPTLSVSFFYVTIRFSNNVFANARKAANANSWNR